MEEKIRFTLCCLFKEENIKFKTTTVKYFSKLSSKDKAEKLDNIVLNNLHSLMKSLHFCALNEIFSFRIISNLLPLYTHPDCKYSLKELPSSDEIFELFELCKGYAEKENIRLSFHPDQFVILNSPREDVVEKSIEDLLYQSYLSELLGADVINIHAGGVYGNKERALVDLRKGIQRLPVEVLSRLTLENDDKSYTPEDLLPVCEELSVPLVYDVHHHRCLEDNLSEEKASKRAYKTWNREPLFHISSPKEGWEGPNPLRHHDYIDFNDFPQFWKGMTPLTVDVEAKAKELAVLKIKSEVYK